MSAEHDDGVEKQSALDDILAAGRVVIDEARATIADLDAAMNTAVNVIPRSALDAPEPPDE